MQRTMAILRRELIAIFSSPLAYLVMTGFLLAQGVLFYLFVVLLNDPSASFSPLQAFLGGTPFFWFILMFVVPAMTMRLIAEERRTGTIEVLLTTSVTETQVVIGKFLAAMALYVALWAPTVAYVLLIGRKQDLDPGPVLGGYLGTLLVGFLFVAFGTFASSVTNNQLIAALIAFVGLLVLWVVPLFEHILLSDSLLKSVLTHMDLFVHLEAFSMGIIDTRYVVFPLSTGAFFLFLAVKSLELKKWR